ncbi:sensor histidine kinase [Halobacteriovorax marinus]|uniref:sensor histidine kinase n=1 Tax=Halobacteriovorax marinus TaxID=97084 RepID=UPI003A953EBA
MEKRFNFWGTLESKELEREFLNSKWNENKNYIFLTYFLCCFFFLLAGVFGDFQRAFHIASAKDLLLFRVFLLMISMVFFVIYGRVQTRPKNLELWLDAMKYLSTAIIVLLTFCTQGTSLTLLPGSMMMVIGFYMILPGRIFSSTICALTLMLNFLFLQDARLTYGVEVHRYMAFMLFAIEVLLCTFKIKHDKWARGEFISQKELDGLNSAKDKILATIGHDVRSPLVIMLSRAESSLISLENNELDKVKKSQEIIVRTVLKLDGMLSDIVNWAISELQQGRESRSFLNIEESINEAVEFNFELAKEKMINIKKSTTPCKFLYEHRMVSICFRNIISNAVKFSPGNSTIEINGERVGDHYILRVEDEGPGMDEELITKIKRGENFNRHPGTEGEMGTGLGLRLVRNVLDKHGAEMELSPRENKGMSFIVKFPVVGEKNA